MVKFPCSRDSPVADITTINVQHTRITTSVVRSRLILVVALSAAPGFAFLDRPATARVATDTAEVDVAVAVAPTATVVAAAEESAFAPTRWEPAHLGGVDATVFTLALQAAEAAIERGDVHEPATLTIIDFSKPSTSKRMYVYDLHARTLLFEELVAHGRNSGHNLTTAFSNAPESNKSSLGLYRTAEGYTGKHGYSLRLDGLEPGFNDRARQRAIVIHGADYVNGAGAQAQGRLGRSLGCPAVRPEIASYLIDAVKDGGLVFAYYPDPTWLNASTYLN